VTARRYAAIDIGTVTTRLLVADVLGGAPGSSPAVTEVERSTDITHLGRGLTRTGALAPEAMRDVAQVLARYRDRLDALGVEGWRAVATSASRDAANSAQFLGMLEEVGIRPDIIDGRTEAELSFRGATLGVDARDVLLDDIGGGSTELVLGSARAGTVSIEAARSIDVGSRRLSELVLLSDPPTAGEQDAARAHAAAAFAPFFAQLGRVASDVISVAGTATSLVSVRLKLAEYDPAVVHGARLTLDEVRETRAYLAGMSLERRLGVVGLHPGRAPVIVAGALVLEAVLEGAGADSTLVSERDILYGILLEVAGSSAGGDVPGTGGSG